MLFPAGGMTTNQWGKEGGGTHHADFFKLSNITEK